ncbi:type III-B CRISPR module-associated protein Cmr3 [bacterium]|nr:type III-B CRISPR module-associated protein Cmr3 [bacterium]
MTEYIFLEPIDVFYLRGNKLFGGPGDHGEALMPPWPSIAAGALRTKILAEYGGISFEDYRNNVLPEGAAGKALGSPERPGLFRLSFFSVGLKANGAVRPVFPLPADLVSTGQGAELTYMTPTIVNKKLSSGYPLRRLPVLAQVTPRKPDKGLWLSPEGLKRYLKGKPFEELSVMAVSDLWERDPRLGIALSAKTRSTDKGRIYTTETIALKKNVGFLTGLIGDQGLLSSPGVVRFGGDGRGAVMSLCKAVIPEPDWQEIARSRRFKLVLTTPGLFPKGWLPPGTQDETLEWSSGSLKAKLACASLSPYEVISGWDLVTRRPKQAMKAVPAASVYWFEDMEGDVEALRELVSNGLWDEETSRVFPQRRAEGFNNIIAACWPNR